MEANERFGKYYSGVIIEAMEGIACREMQGSREKVLGMDIFPSGLVVKNLRANAGATEDVSSIPGSRRFPGVGNGSSLQYFWNIEKFYGQRSLVGYIPWDRKESDMTEQSVTHCASNDNDIVM